jgi:glycosyltransferase involved in cell wall biosynthesis
VDPVTRDAAAPSCPARVAYVLGTSTGGIGSHVAMLAEGCAARGIAVRIFGPAATGRQFFPAPCEFTPIGIGDRPRAARDAAATLRLRHLLRDWAPDVVHAHGQRAGGVAALALTGVPAPPYQRHRPLIVTVHNAPPAAGAAGIVYAGLERITARRADAVTWVSNDLGARIRRLGARDGGRAVVAAPQAAPPTADAVLAARASLDGHGAPVVLAVGRLAEQKGYPALLAAAARWQDRDPVPLLAIAGAGPLAGPLAETARATGITVRFLGQRADVPALLAAADVVVVPSLWEGQPLIVQETLRAGRPLVATRTGGIPELTGEDAALLVPVGDSATLAAAVLSVLDDRALAAALSAAAARRAGSLPATGDAVDSAVGLYRRVIRAAG